MKRTLLSAVAALTLVGPFTTMSAFADPNDHQDHQGYQGQMHQGPQVQGQAQVGPAPQHDGRHQWRDTRANAQWDQSQHNGYYQGNRWHFGPPAADARGVSFGYHPWSRGQRLGYYRNQYSEVNYRDQQLRRPPHGYHWVRDDRGDFLLAAIASGLIAQVILNER